MGKTPRRAFGDDAEAFVCDWLKRNAFRVDARNYATSSGEIDIIAYDKTDRTLCFIEVKARSNENAGHPGEAITRGKIRKIALTANQYIRANKLDSAAAYRFDVALLERRADGGPDLLNQR